MTKRKTKDTEQWFNLIKEVANKYEISREKVLDLFIDSINKVLTKIYQDRIFKFTSDAEKGIIKCEMKFEVVDDNCEYDDLIQIPLSEAQANNPKLNVGDECLFEFDIYDNKKLTNQEIIQIMQIFKQRLNELNNIKVYEKWKDRVNTLILAEVDKHDSRNGSYLIDLKDGTDNKGFLAKSETIPDEKLIPGQKYKFLVKEVKEHSKGWPIILSRGDEKFVEKLLEENIPEISSGEILVKAIKRIPGFKTKVAVANSSLVSNFDPAAIVVGQKGNRIKNLSSQINNEKVEIYKYNDDLKTFLMNICGSNIAGYKILMNQTDDHINEKPHITLIVEEQTLPVIIGKKGFNIKLIANLLNSTVDIHTVEQANALNIDYEKVDHQNLSSSNKVVDKYNKNIKTTPSYKTNNPQTNINNKMKITNEELLDDIDNLSEDELKKLFNIDVNQASEGVDENKNNNQDLDLDDYNDDDLSNAFANEIDNISNDENNKK